MRDWLAYSNWQNNLATGPWGAMRHKGCWQDSLRKCDTKAEDPDSESLPVGVEG